MSQEDRDNLADSEHEVTGDDFVSLDEAVTDDAAAAEEADLVGSASPLAADHSSPEPTPMTAPTPTPPAQPTFDEFAEETSVLDAGFAAPHRDDVEPEPESRDVLSGREATPVVAEDGETLIATPRDDDPTSTGVMRRSLFGSPAPAEAPTQAIAPSPMTDATAPTTPATPTTPAAGHTATAENPFARIFDEVDQPGQVNYEGLSPEAALLDGATILPEVPSRQPSRWLSAIAFILLSPVAWYLLSDAAGRLVLANNAPWQTGQLNPAALVELLGGLAVLVLLAVVAAQSSLGLYLAGAVFTVLGAPFIVAPTWTQDLINSALVDPLTRLGPFGENALFYLQFTGATGILFSVGVIMIVSGWVVTRVRRKGRAEEALRGEVAAINPNGLQARWARKATQLEGKN